MLAPKTYPSTVAENATMRNEHITTHGRRFDILNSNSFHSSRKLLLNTAAAECRSYREKPATRRTECRFAYVLFTELLANGRRSPSEVTTYSRVTPLRRCWRGAMQNPAICQDGAVGRSAGVVAADADGNDASVVNVRQRQQANVSPNSARANLQQQHHWQMQFDVGYLRLTIASHGHRGSSASRHRPTDRRPVKGISGNGHRQQTDSLQPVRCRRRRPSAGRLREFADRLVLRD
jgi:hypothetical protein